MAYKMKGFPMIKGTSPAKETVKRGRKKHARGSREYAHVLKGQEVPSTHVMAHQERDGKFYAFPTITTDKEGYKVREKETAMEEAERAGELYEFKNKRRAERFAAGSWKKGKDRREAMRAYRKRKREERRDSKKIHPDNVTEAQKRQARDNYEPKGQNVDELD